VSRGPKCDRAHISRWSSAPIDQCPLVSNHTLHFYPLSTMLSRFSSLFAYVVLGLVISAAATPMVPSSDHDIDDGPKSLSHPDSSYSSPTSPMYPTEKRPEGKNPKDKFTEAKPPFPKEKPHEKVDDKDKASGDRLRLSTLRRSNHTRKAMTRTSRTRITLSTTISATWTSRCVATDTTK
jgi:hypothetical protein